MTRIGVNKARLRVAFTADPEIPVPPNLYGGIERIVDMLARGLSARGHEVTLFAHSGSATAGNLIPWPGGSSRSFLDSIQNASLLGRAVLGGEYDLVHSFARLAYLTPLLPLRIPKIMSYQRQINVKTVRMGHALSRGTLSFTAISNWMMQQARHIGHWDMIPNGVPIDTYFFVPKVPSNAPLIFLGRVEEIKGPHVAIEVARRAGVPLVIAGNIPQEHQRWADQHVLAHVDGEAVTYVGPVNDAQKCALLGRSRALLMPILWDEPFGIVMAEAMACGTPVLGFRRGAVPEVVEDGVTGFVVDTKEEMVAAVSRIEELPRAASRKRVERCYSRDAVTDAYLRVYYDAIDRAK